MKSTHLQESGAQSVGEELANTVTHGLGAVLAIAGTTYLAGWAVVYGDAPRVAAVGVYGFTLCALYLASTLYHRETGVDRKRILRHIDRSAVFAFIAGCYTPFTLVSLRGPFGWSMLAVIWAIAAVGIALECTLKARFLVWSTAFYLGMGWLALLIGWPLAHEMAAGGLALMVVGGVSYTIGVGFFWWTRLPFHHTIWHLFVLAGTACHFGAISLYVLPMP